MGRGYGGTAAALRAGVAGTTLESLTGWESPMASVAAAVRTGLWNEGLASIRSAHEAGVRIAVGTDTNNPFVFPGHSVHLELELLVEVGLTPMGALVAADPLADIRNTRSLDVVIRGGEVVERSSLLAHAVRTESAR